MSLINLERLYTIPEEILKKMKRKKKYIDGNKYIFLEEKYYYENPYYVMKEKVEEKATQNIYTRSLYIIFKNTSKTVADRINQRRKWKPFNLQDSQSIQGNDIKHNNTTTVGDDIFMEMNPKLFKYYNKEKYNKNNDIGINDFENNNKSTDIVTATSKLICVHCGGKHWSRNCVMNISGLGTSLLGQNNKKGYIAPHLKRQHEEEEQNLTKSIKIQNIPNYLSKEDIEDWLSQFRLAKYRLAYIRNKRTDEFKGLVFINFNFHKDAVDSIKVLEGQRLDYNIIEPALAN
jgi:hypothetical protein